MSGPRTVEAHLGIGERLLVDGLLCPGYRWAPGVLRALRPWLVRFLWSVAPDVRRSLLRNAKVLMGPGHDASDHRRFGLEVLTEVQRFTEELVRTGSNDALPGHDDLSSIGNIHRYYARRKAGGGIVIATAHMGSFEVAARILVQLEKKVHVVYARDPSRTIERTRSRLRRRLGVIEHAVDDGIGTWRALQEALENDEAVAMPADRVQPGQTGFDVELMGATTRLPAGPFKLAMTAGAPLVPAFCARHPDGRYRVTVEPPIEFAGTWRRDLHNHEGVRTYVDALGRMLERYPTQWLMVFDAFRDRTEEPTA